MHLAAAADAPHLGGVEAAEQFRNSFQNCLSPVLGILLAPPRLGEFQGIFLCDRIFDFSGGIHQQKLYRRGSQVNTDIVFHINPIPFLILKRKTDLSAWLLATE